MFLLLSSLSGQASAAYFLLFSNSVKINSYQSCINLRRNYQDKGGFFALFYCNENVEGRRGDRLVAPTLSVELGNTFVNIEIGSNMQMSFFSRVVVNLTSSCTTLDWEFKRSSLIYIRKIRLKSAQKKICLPLPSGIGKNWESIFSRCKIFPWLRAFKSPWTSVSSVYFF